jgi:hypothetical protein
VTSIWISEGDGWRLLAPTGFTYEKTLHELVERSPELLPLAGSPRLVMLGREVPLGGGYADLLAVEPTGRVVVIEVKLASNAEARRAVVAQILAYAAFLKGTDLEMLEGEILRSSLTNLGHPSISAAVEQADQDGSFDRDVFADELGASLATGRFRLVLVLDDAPPELVRLVGYLESIAPDLVIDLIAVGAYEANGARLLVPQRLDSERPQSQPKIGRQSKAAKQGYLIPPEEFEAGIAEAPASAQPQLTRMYAWARSLEERQLVHLLAFRGTTGRTTLLPYVPDDEAGLITVWNEDKGFSLSFWRSVFERHAPNSIGRIEALIAPSKLGQGTVVKELSDELLVALTGAYEEAAS